MGLNKEHKMHYIELPPESSDFLRAWPFKGIGTALGVTMDEEPSIGDHVTVTRKGVWQVFEVFDTYLTNSGNFRVYMSPLVEA